MRSGWFGSTPESMTATVTLLKPVVIAQALLASIAVAFHWDWYKGSFGSNDRSFILKLLSTGEALKEKRLNLASGVTYLTSLLFW